VQACGDESFSPIVENVAGSYQAATLTATLGDLTTDLLDLGSTLTLTLNADGTTEGRLLGPGLGEGGTGRRCRPRRHVDADRQHCQL